MIFITGDVHQLGRRMQDQKHLPNGLSELALCEQYLEICNKYRIEPTLFLTGLAAHREPSLLESLCRAYQFEMGGHTYDAVRHRILLGLSRRGLGLANGPPFWQRRDMLRTLRCLQGITGAKVTSWRNHAYRTDKNTSAIAEELNILQISNVVSDVNGNIRKVGRRLVEIPINTLPDHESLGHGGHSRVCVSAQEWARRVLEQIEYQQKNQLPSVVLAHPLCMYLEDRMSGFKRLCASLTGAACRRLDRWNLAVAAGNLSASAD